MQGIISKAISISATITIFAIMVLVRINYTNIYSTNATNGNRK